MALTDETGMVTVLSCVVPDFQNVLAEMWAHFGLACSHGNLVGNALEKVGNSSAKEVWVASGIGGCRGMSLTLSWCVKRAWRSDYELLMEG